MIKIWQTLTPWTRRTIIISCAATVITTVICAAASGSMDDLFKMIVELLK